MAAKAALRPPNTAYDQISSSISLSDFSWREVRLRAAPSFPPAKGSGLGGDAIRNSGKAGGFHYSDSALGYSPSRNRFILWHYLEGHLKLLEISLDHPLAHNALELVLDGSDHLLPDVTICEHGKSDVMVLFCTSSTAYRLVLPHPDKIRNTPSLSEIGEGMVPSVLAFASERSFVGASMAALFNEPANVVAVTSCAAGVSPDGTATFALSSPSGSILLIQILPPHRQGLPVRSELRESSIMSKLWSSLLPVVGRGVGPAEDAPLSLLLHVFEGQPVIIALCADLKLRLWSAQIAQCVMTHTLSQYLYTSNSTEMKVDQLLLKGATDSSTRNLKLAVHLRNCNVSQISIFEILHIEDQLHLQIVHTYRCPHGGALVDFFLSEREVWGLWEFPGKEGEGDITALKHAYYDIPLLSTGWQDIFLYPLPTKEPLVLPHQEPREFFLDAIFHPGRFSTVSITKTLELYNGKNVGTLKETMEEVTRRVEHEMQVSASTLEMGSEEYRQLSTKCWSKFYSCCLEYQELVSRSLAVFHDPGTGMGVLLKQGVVSFLKPAELSVRDGGGIDLALLAAEDSVLRKDVDKFLCCMRKTLKQVSPDLMESFNLELGCRGNPDASPPITLATELADVIHDELWDVDVYSDLYSVRNISDVFDALLEALDPLKMGADGGVAEEMDEENIYQGHPELRASVAQVFGAPLCINLLGSAFQGVCHFRLCLCRDILIMLFVLRRGEATELLKYVRKEYNVHFSRLVSSYYALYWITSNTAMPTSLPIPHDSNLQQFATLTISSGRGSPFLHCPTLPLLYLSTRGHQELAAELVKEQVLPADGSYHAHWQVLVPKMVQLLIKLLWPRTSSCKVAEFLLENGQYNHLQTFVALVMGSHTLPFGHSLLFLLGKAHVYTGELEKASQYFMQAFLGIESERNPMLQQLVKQEGSDDEEGGVARYFEVVMRMFEQVPSPQYIIKTAESAVLMLDKGHPKSTLFWSNLFKHHLDLGHAQEAYDAMNSNPNITLRLDCLRRLVVVLTEQNMISELCHFSYKGMEKEIEAVIETRARSVDVVKHNYYDLLYCFHTHRLNFRKAAYVMYECGLRLARESTGPQSLQRQANCYSMCILALHLTDPKYAWVLRPVQESRALDEPRSHRKRPRRVSSHGKQPVEVLTAQDIEKDYMLVRAKLDLLEKEPSLVTQLSSPFLTAQELCSFQVQVGMFEAALNLSKRLSLPLTPIFESLASRCVHFSANLVAFGQQPSDKAGWEWLGLNEGLDASRARETSIADKAWGILRMALEQLDTLEQAVIQKCIAKKLLSLGKDLPQWLLDTYKKTNPAELLKLYLTFDLLVPALLLAIEYIDGVMGHGKEFFGLEDALHSDSRIKRVWLPSSTFSHLQLALAEAPPNSSLQELSKAFEHKLSDYMHQADIVTDNITMNLNCH